MGASEVVITDIMDNRLEVAKSLGADHVYKVSLVFGLALGPCSYETLTCSKLVHSLFLNRLRRGAVYIFLP